MNCEKAVETEILVIGYGNTLRGDDGVGPRVAEAIEELNLPGVRTLVCQLLTPEFADPIARTGSPTGEIKWPIKAASGNGGRFFLGGDESLFPQWKPK
jgi:hypothetical protein